MAFTRLRLGNDRIHSLMQRKRELILGGPLIRPRLIVADDNPLFLQKLVALLATEFDVVATATDGKAALDVTRRYHPDLVLVDLNMPVKSGIEVAEELAKNPSGPPVIICSSETDSEIVEAARQAGAVEYVFKARIETDLILAANSAVHDSLSEALTAERGFGVTETVNFAR
jgi:DNA-binding NarL/FixJ family response regulator